MHNRSVPVLGPLRHLGSGLAYLATARRMHASDRTTADQLAWQPAGSPLPPGLALTWIGTAGFRLEGEISDRGVDLFLCGISGRRFTPRYIERIVRALEPRLVVPTHYDDFFRPLGAPVRFSFNVNLTGFADEVRAASRDLPVRILEVGAPV